MGLEPGSVEFDWFSVGFVELPLVFCGNWVKLERKHKITGFYRVLVVLERGLAEFDRLPLEVNHQTMEIAFLWNHCNRNTTFAWVYRVLLGFTEFYRVLPSIRGF